MKDTIIRFFKSEQGKRCLYEAKSFAMTFGSILVLLVGADNFTSLDVIISNKDIILASVSVALTRTVAIYALNFLGIADFRQSTKDYK